VLFRLPMLLWACAETFTPFFVYWSFTLLDATPASTMTSCHTP
jgi:hypothetical protein